MRRTIVLVLTGTAVVSAGLVQGGAFAATRSGTTGPAVAIRIEGTNKTLLLPRRVKAGSGWITKFGAPEGKCPAQSVQGALDRATHGHWQGSWNSQFNEYFVTSILGEKPPTSHDFWEIFVNNTAATKGACDLKLQSGEQIVFADTDGKQTPAALKADSCVAPGAKFKVKLLGYSAHGKAKPLPGVKVTGNGIKSATTNRMGIARLTAGHTGRLVVRASPPGYIRTEAVVPVVSQACSTY